VSAGRRPTAWPGLAALAAVLLAAVARTGRLLPGDAAGARLLHLPPLPMRLIAAATSTGVLVGLALLLAWVLRRHARALRFLTLLAAVPLMEDAMKVLVRRPRPPGPEAGWGFPSGHAMAAMALAVLALGAAWPSLPGRAKLAALAAAASGVAVVGLSRVALGAHWMSDVVGGWLFGLAYGAWVLPAVSATLPRAPRRRGAPRPS